MSRFTCRELVEHELAHLNPRIEGKTIRCNSPSTGYHRRPPFVVNLEKCTWYDYSTGRGGNVVQLIRLLHRSGYCRGSKYVSSFSYPIHQPNTYQHRHTREQVPYSEFTFREIVVGGIYNRTNSSRIKPYPDVPDYDGDPTAIDCYHSGFLHTGDFQKYAIEHNGRIAGYNGSVWVDWLTFDIDCGTDLERARGVGLKVYDRLLATGVERYNIRIYFSGNKGFHISFKDPIFDEVNGYESTPEKVRQFVHALTSVVVGSFGNVYTDQNGKTHSIIDPAIYSCTSLIRSPNSRHSVSGLYKIPLSEPEFQYRTIDEIKKMAATQRNLYN